jgi:hypothetical protein
VCPLRPNPLAPFPAREGAISPRVGPKTRVGKLANPQPTRVGKGWVEGAQAPSQGVWGMCPQEH